MVATLSSDPRHPANGRLDDVFESAKRGVVVVISDLDGAVRIGHSAVIQGLTARMTGTRTIRHMDPPNRVSGNIGPLVERIDEAGGTSAIGTRVTVQSGEAS